MAAQVTAPPFFGMSQSSLWCANLYNVRVVPLTNKLPDHGWDSSGEIT